MEKDAFTGRPLIVFLIVAGALLAGVVLNTLVPLPVAAPASTAGQPAARQQADEGALELGRELTRIFYEGELDELWGRMNESIRRNLGGVDRLRAFRAQVEAQLGREVAIVSETVEDEQGATVYTRKARFERSGETVIDVVFATDAEAVVTAFLVRPADEGGSSGPDVGSPAETAAAERVADGLRTWVPAAPLPVPAEGSTHLVYELVVRNQRDTEIALEGVVVRGDGEPLARLEGDELASATAGGVRVPAGQGRRVFLWVELDAAGALPAELGHEVVVGAPDGTGGPGSVEGPALATVVEAAVVLGPPLRGGDWLTGNGPGNDSAHRRAAIGAYEARPIAQRFAIDFVRVVDGRTHDGSDPEDNATYHAWGQAALAVADAEVVATRDGIPENVPGISSRAVEITLETVAGNHVVLDLGGGRFALYAHFQPGSLQVAPGDRVRRGDVLGLVGNSGNSTEPHLHFHVADGPEPLGAEGIPWVLERFRSQGSGAEREAIVSPESGELRRREIPLGNRVIAFLE